MLDSFESVSVVTDRHRFQATMPPDRAHTFAPLGSGGRHLITEYERHPGVRSLPSRFGLVACVLLRVRQHRAH